MAEIWNITNPVMNTKPVKCTCAFRGYDNHMHKGADLIPNSTSITPDILAFDDGVVIATGNVNGTVTGTGTKACGTYVAIRHNDGTITRYQHLMYNSLKVRKGSKVTKGQIIAKYGRPTTGNSTGSHLHFDISLPNKPSQDYIEDTFCGETRYYVNPKPYLCKTASTVNKYKVTASALNVRAGAGTEFSVVEVIKKDCEVTITEQKNGFGKIGANRWISMVYVKEM